MFYIPVSLFSGTLGTMYFKVIVTFCLFSQAISYHFKPGIIIQKDKDVLLFDKSVETAIDISAIFLSENNIDSIHENVLNIQTNLERLKNIYFTKHSHIPDKSLQPSYNISHYTFKAVYEKVITTKALINSMKKWVLPNEVDQKRNPILLAFLSGFGLIGLLTSIGISIASLVEAKANSRRLKKIEKHDSMIDLFLHKHVDKTNELIHNINNMTQVLNDLSKLEVLNTQLLLIDSKLDTIQTNLFNFESETKDYIEAITLATKGILSPRLLPVNELTRLIQRAHQFLKWTPVADYKNLELYYSFINVNLINGKIKVIIPFNVVEFATSYIIKPFPTPVHDNNLIISNVSRHILTLERNSFTAEIEVNTLDSCKFVFDKLLCPANQFTFIKDNCTQTLTRERNELIMGKGYCHYPLTYFRGPLFVFQLLNGTKLIYNKEEMSIQCRGHNATISRGTSLIHHDCKLQSDDILIYDHQDFQRGHRYPKLQLANPSFEFQPITIQIDIPVIQDLPAYDNDISSYLPEPTDVLTSFFISIITSMTLLLIMLIVRRQCNRRSIHRRETMLDTETGVKEANKELITPISWRIMAP